MRELQKLTVEFRDDGIWVEEHWCCGRLGVLAPKGSYAECKVGMAVDRVRAAIGEMLAAKQGGGEG